MIKRVVSIARSVVTVVMTVMSGVGWGRYLCNNSGE